MCYPESTNGYTAENTIRIATSGVKSARIRWVAETKWAARIIGHVNPANRLGWGIVVAGNYVDLVGFDVTSNANMGVWILGTHVRVIGNHVHNIPGQAGCSSYGAPRSTLMVNLDRLTPDLGAYESGEQVVKKSN